MLMRFLKSASLVLLLATLAGAQTPQRLTLTRTLKLDANTEDFSALRMTREGNTPFYVGPRGEIVVPQPQDYVIRIYDSTGKRITTVGRQGSGPGEFRNFFRLGWTRDTLWVYDASQRRLSYFDASWTFARTTVLSETLRQRAEGQDPRVITDFAPSAIAGGNMLGQIILTNGRAPAGWLQFQYFVASVGADFSVKQLAEIPAAAVSPRAYVTFDGTPGYTFAIVPFGNDASYTVSTAGDRFALVTTDHKAHMYTVSTYGPAGQVIFTRAYPYQPKALPAATVDSAVTAATRNVRQGADVAAALQKKLREAMPAEYPPVASVVLARDGRTWLRVRSPSGDSMVILDAKGVVVATATLPPGVDLVDADARRAWGVETDADGLGSVVVYSIAAR